jgi:hypothetical protein
MAGPRVYDLEEVNELLPDLERLLDGLDEIRSKIRTLKLRINALEMIWGEAVHRSDNTDHTELQHHLEEMKGHQHSFEEITKRIAALGGQLKGLEPPLVDFYGVRDGHLVFWCWTRGEDRIDHWHHVDEGFAGRQPV